MNDTNINNNAPVNVPLKKSGTFTVKVIMKTDYVRKDGTCALYLQIFIDGDRKRLPLDIYVKKLSFDPIKQKIKGRSESARDTNLLIEKKKADINRIAVGYRLSGLYLSLDLLIEELQNPSSKIDFITFYREELKKQIGLIAKGTYDQQKSTLKKIEGFKNQILFQEITEDLFNNFIKYCKTQLKNKPITIETAKKNFKKFLGIANRKGIKTKLNSRDISIKRHHGSRVFLEEFEIKTLYEYRESKFISESNKNILDRFLFSCFTGLRISDIQDLKITNFVNDFVIFNANKTTKLQKIKLNKSAQKFVNLEDKVVFLGHYTDQHINKQLKEIAKSTNIKKRLTFHVARHTFATNYLIKGGRVENLQKILAHSSITETMIYVHIVDNILNDEIINLDSILD